MKYSAAFFIMSFLLSISVLSGSALGDNEGVLQIEADAMMIDNVAMTVLFKGKVEANYAGSTINAEKIRAFFDSETKGLLRLKAEGDVRIVQGERIITGQLAEFNQEKGIVRVSGDPRLTDGKSVLEGEEVVVDLVSRQGSITGGVRAIFDISAFPSTLSGLKANGDQEKGGQKVP